MSELISRLLAGVVAIGVWYVSYVFSVNGFNLLSSDPKYSWIGSFLALAITAYELIWNGMKHKKNMTMYYMGLGCYIYGIGTNILGGALWLGVTKQYVMGVVNNPNAWDVAVLICYAVLILFLAIGFEASPEPTLVYAITGDFSGGDFLGNLNGQHNHASNTRTPDRVAQPFNGAGSSSVEKMREQMNNLRNNQPTPQYQGKSKYEPKYKPGREPQNQMTKFNEPTYHNITRDDE